jgi:hypothetical protein
MSAQRSDKPPMREALRALKQRPGKPTEDERPPPSVFPGRKHEPLPGQLDIFGREVPPET